MSKTLNIGIATYEDFKARSLKIARGELKPGVDEPEVWFPSIESFARVLSASNRELLSMIQTSRPGSLQELSTLSGRAKSNLSRTLKTMERYGIVEIESARGGRRTPHVRYTRFKLEASLGL